MKSTKKALFMSCLSLLLCVSMLVGTTFAWFTDSVTSGVNQIIAGNLDIEVSYKDDGEWKSIQGVNSLFSKGLWEPGHTEFVTLKIENKGTLALNYKLMVTPVSENGGINVDGQPFKLSDYLRFGTTTPADTEPTGLTRETARQSATNEGLVSQADMNQSGTMLAKAAGAAENPAKYVTLVIYMPETVGNEANYKTGTTAPQINLGITVLATQMENELDSFGNDYDTNATGDSFYVAESRYNYFPQVAQTAKVNKTTVDGVETVTVADDANVSVAQNGDVTIRSAAKASEEPGAEPFVTVTIPKDRIEDGDSEPDVHARKVDASEANLGNIVVHSDQETLTLDVSVGSTKSDGSLYKVELAIGAGKTNLSFYHGDVLMTAVSGTPDADTYVYDAASGKLTMYVSHFSEFTAVFDEPVAAVGSTAYYSLEAAVAAGSQVTLLKDITLAATVTINKDVTLNLNGKTLTGNGVRALHVVGGNVNISNGVVTVSEGINESSSVIRVGDNSGEARKVSLTVGESVTVKSDYSYGITVFGKQTTETVTVNGKVVTSGVPAISGNGSAGYGNTTVTINGTVETTSENAVYQPQSGTLTINGTVKGQGGIEAKAGTVVLGANAVVTATGTATQNSVNDNGCSTSGYAIALVNNNNYAGSAKAEITAGKINGVIGVVDDNTVEAAKKASLTVKGGTFSVEPQYVAEGLGTVDNGDGTWGIAKAFVARIGETVYDSIDEAFANVKSGDTIEIGKAGSYTLPTPISNITIKSVLKDSGYVKSVQFNAMKAYGESASKLTNVTFENVQFNFGTNLYTGFQHSEKAIFNNCSFTGRFNSYGEMIFNDCHFQSPKGDYAMWLYAGDVSFDGCVFDSDGKIFNVYNEGNTNAERPWVVTVKNCTFNSTAIKKAALNVKENCGNKALYYNVFIDNCKTNANFPAASGDANSALLIIDPLVQVDDRTAASIPNTGISITLNGVKVY